MFDESVRILSLINSGDQKSWDIAQRMEIPINRFRAQIKKLLDLNFIGYKADCFEYFLTTRGENVLRSVNSKGKDVGENPFILMRP